MIGKIIFYTFFLIILGVSIIPRKHLRPILNKIRGFWLGTHPRTFFSDHNIFAVPFFSKSATHPQGTSKTEQSKCRKPGRPEGGGSKPQATEMCQRQGRAAWGNQELRSFQVLRKDIQKTHAFLHDRLAPLGEGGRSSGPKGRRPGSQPVRHFFRGSALTTLCVSE
jgi:hypothetical protein